MLNKLDSRIIEDIIVVKGPYSALYGPDLRFMDIDLLHSPRYEDGWQLGGSTSLNYQTNGDQIYGRQTLQGGENDWGFRLGYGHKTGSDYQSGDGTDIPSSYKSRDVDFALGYDLSEDSSIELHYLRLDQTDVEFPGQLFDMDFLKTDGVEATYELRNQEYVDRLVIDTWYNQTRFKGNAQSPAKRTQFPGLFGQIGGFRASTDVDTASAGYRILGSWDLSQQTRLTAGTDLRLIQQSLDEFASGVKGFNFFDQVNSPIPNSQSVNPGLLAELRHDVDERLSLTAGTRIDYVDARIDEDPANLQMLGIDGASLAAILGTNQFDQHFVPWAAFLTGQYQLDDDWKLTFGTGHSERPPSLTELYVAESYLFLLQNGENTATGDPRLAPERLTQIDLGLQLNHDRLRGGANGFFGWIQDYITFENMQVLRDAGGNPQQVNLKYVNTDLATLAGFESYLEYDATTWATLFATMHYVEGQDRTRNGQFATKIHSGATASTRVAGTRGSQSGVTGPSSEPLPSILPLESRLGVRLRPPGQSARWSTELSARIVDNQNRIAQSLLESPTPGFTIWDLRGTWQATKSCFLVAGVENFTNKNFREHLDFRSSSGFRVLQPGINFYVGSELKY